MSRRAAARCRVEMPNEVPNSTIVCARRAARQHVEQRAGLARDRRAGRPSGVRRGRGSRSCSASGASARRRRDRRTAACVAPRRLRPRRTGDPAAAQAVRWSGWSLDVSGVRGSAFLRRTEIRLIRRISYSHSPEHAMADRRSRSNFLAKTAATGPLDRAGRGDSGCRCSGSGEGGRAAFHHGAGGREGRGQRRLALPIFPEQGGDPVPPAERRMAAARASCCAASSRTSAKPPLERLRALVHAFIRSECEEAAIRVRAQRRRAALSRRARGAGSAGGRRGHRRSLHAGGAARRPRKRRASWPAS